MNKNNKEKKFNKEIASKKAKEGVANVKNIFNKKKDPNNHEEARYEEVKYEEPKDEPLETENNNIQEGSVIKAPEKNENPHLNNNDDPPNEKKTNFFSRGLSSMVNSTKSVTFYFN